MSLDIATHPCFNSDARHTHSRVHLPVAPDCNVQCNFCNRRFDCLNESRPGVTSSVLTPPQALHYLQRIEGMVDRLSVVGIAGPGDPFANPLETIDTLRLVRHHSSDLLLCVASNGLAIGPYVDELAQLNVSHVTITVNAVDWEIGQRVYAWIRDGKRVMRGRAAAELLLSRQLDAICALAERDILVKVNTIVMPGVNDHHVAEVARTVAAAGASMLNCMPLCPVEDTEFASLAEPSHAMMDRIRAAAEQYLPQMTHCSRCRADAAGRIGEAVREDLTECLQQAARQPLNPNHDRPHVAIATLEGVLVNQHLGEAETLVIYRRLDDSDEYEVVDQRPTPPPGQSAQRWHALADVLDDCHTVLVSGVGGNPRRVLQSRGIKVTLTEGLVQEALESVYEGSPPPPPRKVYRCGEVCSGNGQGCG